MIRIGVTSWADHPYLQLGPHPALSEYARHFPLVEIDTPYYGIPKSATIQKWTAEVPEEFRFIVKGNQAMTLQGRWQEHYPSEEMIYQVYFERFAPMLASGKIACFLLQFPAFFHCTFENVQYLLKIKHFFAERPVAIELRHASWFAPENLKRTLAFFKKQRLHLTIVDEPHAMPGGIPFVNTVQQDDFLFYRLHGRNQAGWSSGKRAERTLYRYSTGELEQIARAIRKKTAEVRDIYVIFNNNSGKDAARNAKELERLLGIENRGPATKQMGLF